MLTTESKLAFIKRLSDKVVAKLAEDITTGKVPVEWEGAELRQLLSDRFAEASPKAWMTVGRKRRYNNAKLIRGL